MSGVIQWILRGARRVFDRIEELVEDIADDPQLQAALETDLGLPLGSLDKERLPPRPDPGIDAYVTAADPNAEQLKVTFEAIKSYIKFWTTVFDAASTDDPSIVADELLYRLLQLTTVDLVKFDHPTAYAVMRVVGAIEQDTRLALEEAFAPEVPANIFTKAYYEAWEAQFSRTYLRFRRDQGRDLLPDTPPANEDPRDAERRLRRERQLSVRVFGLSDAGIALGEVLKRVLDAIVPGATVEHVYGWELPPIPDPPACGPAPSAAATPLADHIASRTSTLRLAVPVDSGSVASAMLTQLLFVDDEDRLAWLLALKGAVAREHALGPPQRPIKVTLTVEARDGLTAVVRFGGDEQFRFVGAPTAGLQLRIEPVQTANRAPALALPETTGSRLEIGEFLVRGALSPDGVGLRAEARKSALVVVVDEADGFVQETLPAEPLRIDFDLGVTLDDRQGLRFDGGGRLGATVPVNRTLGRVRVESVALALAPGTREGGSELRLDASAALGVDLGPLRLSLEGIGATMAVGTSRGAAPPAALQVLSSLLYVGDLGFRPPRGVGIVVDAGSVTGGGFLFYDPDNEQYAGALQLSLGKRWSLSAIGLLTTRLPDGGKGFSLVLVASIEFKPAYPLFLGIHLQGVGVIVGIHRTIDTEALRAGVRNRTLDALLFPRDVVASAPRYVSALKAVFPPARGRHVLGFTVSLTFGESSVVSAELGVVYEVGARRWVVLGQVHAEFPPTVEGRDVTKRKLLEMHVDAVGIWDLARGEFSLDATLYDSRIAFVAFSGDVAVRMRKGDSSFFLFSAGGYHPEFAVPPGVPQLRRLTISLADTKNLRLLLTGYVAITSNTRQIGARMELFAGFSGFSIESTLSFDALWEPDVRFVVVFDVEFKLKYKGVTFFGVDVSGRFTGPYPKRVVGEWSIDLFLTSVSKRFDRIVGDDRPPLELPTVDPLPPLEAALRQPANWRADLPAGAQALVTFRRRLDAGEVLVHPLARLAVRQQVVPLGIDIDRFAGAPIAPRRFEITRATVGGAPPSVPQPVDEQFAAAEFIAMSDDEKLARPSFDAMPAGVALSAQGVTFGGDSVVSEMDVETRVHGASGPVPAPAGPRPVTGALATFAASFGPAARSPLRTTGLERFAATGPTLAVGPERFVVARVDDLAAVPLAGAVSFTVARQMLDGLEPAAGRELQVVPAFLAESQP